MILLNVGTSLKNMFVRRISETTDCKLLSVGVRLMSVFHGKGVSDNKINSGQNNNKEKKPKDSKKTLRHDTRGTIFDVFFETISKTRSLVSVSLSHTIQLNEKE